MGAALAKKMNGDTNTVYCLCGDGESEEGEIWEAAHFGAHHHVDNLVAFTDYNGQQIDGTTEAIAGSHTGLKEKWASFGWDCFEAEGHDFAEIQKAFEHGRSSKGTGKPVTSSSRPSWAKASTSWRARTNGTARLPTRAAQPPLHSSRETMGDY